MLTLNDGRSELWQWDTGRTLAVDADCSQVHFSNKVFGRSIDVDVIGGSAIIPDVLLQTDKDLNVWAFVGTAENGYTKISKTFKVNRRNKPADYVFTQTDQMTLQTIQRQIGDLADLTTEAKDTLVAAINEVARKGGGAGSMDLRVADGYVQYSSDGGMTWTNLIAMADLKGDQGEPGKDGHSPVVTATKSGKTTTISVDGAAIATVEDGADGKPGTDGADGVTPHIGDNGNWYLGDTDTGKPSQGPAGAGMDITGATVGQIVKIKAVDENGKPTEWEAVDLPSGGGSDGWTEIGEITLEGTEFIISAYSDGIVTISPENGVYPQVNKNTVLRKSDYSGYINVKFIATGTEGQYTMKNLDGAVYAPSDDLTQYVVDVPSADSISFSNIPEFSHLKAKVTTPLLSVHGTRKTLSISYAPFDLVGSDCAYLSGGAAEVVLETEDSPIAGKIYGKGSFKGESASRTNGYDIIRMFDRPTAPTNIKFAHYNGLLTIGTKVKLWGRN